MLNLDEAGVEPRVIAKGLKVDEGNQADMKRLLKAQKRLDFEDEDRDLHSLEPLELRL